MTIFQIKKNPVSIETIAIMSYCETDKAFYRRIINSIILLSVKRMCMNIRFIFINTLRKAIGDSKNSLIISSYMEICVRLTVFHFNS